MKNKIKFNLLAMFLFATTVLMADPVDDGAEPPPNDPLPIDDFLIVLIIAGLCLAFYVFTRKNRLKNSSL